MGSAGPIYDKSIPQKLRSSKCQGRVVAYLLSEDKMGDNNKTIKEKNTKR